MKLFDSVRRALGRRDDRLAEEALQEDTAVDPAIAAAAEYDTLRGGGLMGSRSDVLDHAQPPEETD